MSTSPNLFTDADILAEAERWKRAGYGVAIATVVETWGSAPRPVGSHLIIDNEGNFLGSVSGGCVEGAVISEALEVIESGKAKLLEFGVADETAWRVGLSCGGKIAVRVESVAEQPWVLPEVNAAVAAREAVAIVTELESGESLVLTPDQIGKQHYAEELREAFRTGRSGIVEAAGMTFFINVHVPPVKLVIIGAVHISQALAEMARVVGLDCVIVDPRTAFATPERFPQTRVIAEWPDVALPPLGLDRYTAFVALTHDPKIDDPAILHAVGKGCFYLGTLGSRKTHAKRLERLAAAGVSEADRTRIHAPIGLDIGAVSPAEIAVSILGEIIATMRQKRRSPVSNSPAA
ncbi:MAG: XdhC/CoxI family protein [Rhizobiales bacterium PAR1]|nr:MAG: XdhC/CoxI family protein [Rhizobiales bacterium PAR1]